MSSVEIVMTVIAGLEAFLVAILLGVRFRDYRSQEEVIRKIVKGEITNALREYEQARDNNVITSGAEVFFEGCHETILKEHLQALKEASISHAHLPIESGLRKLKSYLLRERVDWQALPKDMRDAYIEVLCSIENPLASEVLSLINQP